MASTKDLLTQAQGLLTQALASLPADVQPAYYQAVTDRIVRPKPAPLALGPAGFAFNDPLYKTPMWRITDRLTNNGQSYRVPSNAACTAWASNSKRFHLMDGGGTAKVWDFDGVHFTPSAWEIRSAIEPWFSYTDPDLAYGAQFHTILRFHATGAKEIICDLKALYPQYSLPDDDPGRDYLGGLCLMDGDLFTVLFGGGTQDRHYLIHHSKAGLFDSLKEPIPFRIHGQGGDRTGRWIFIFPVTADIKTAGQIVIWDTQTGTRTSIPDTIGGGHGILGYGTYINQQGWTSPSNQDNLEWQIRDILSPFVTKDLVQVLTPGMRYISDHLNWRHCIPGVMRPVISATFRYGAATNDGVNQPDGLNFVKYPPRAWDDEILYIATDLSGVVGRFGHHQSVQTGAFEDQPIVNVSPDGCWLTFTSNWGLTVGAARQDGFLMRLK